MRFVAVLVVFLAVYNNVLNLWPTGRFWYVPLNLSVGALLVLAARANGYSWSSLGFSREAAAPGARWGLGVVGIVALGLLLVFVLPGAERLLHDQRVVGLGGVMLAYTVLVRIPLGTALFEELAFRGVLQGAWTKEAGVAAALVGSSVVFGLWHVMPALELMRTNEIAAGAPALRGLAVAGACVGTALGGLFLGWLRIRTGGILAPVLVHAGANSLATMAAAAAQRGAAS